MSAVQASANQGVQTTRETTISPTSGWPILIGYLVLLLGGPLTLALLAQGRELNPFWVAPFAVVWLIAIILIPIGFYVVNPNMARVLVLFGRYRGSVRRDGFFWTNPFTIRHKLSLRAHNLDGAMLKVNDLAGNPIEISAVIVWRVEETARAQFDVEDYVEYVRVQSEAAVRQLATTHPYDDAQREVKGETTLRGNSEEVADELRVALTQRLETAGIEVIEARLNHLAYAPEIASAMLQRQQAKAVVDARMEIVDGAVGMVEMALEQLSAKEILELDSERRATLVGNLLVVLCGQSSPQPVLNTGSLYN